jgi:ferredoxin
MNGFVAEITALGPTGTSEGAGAESLKPKLQSLYRMVPQLKLMVREKLQVRVKSAEAYEKLYANPATDALIDALMADPAATAEELPAYYIEPDKCVGCLICQKKCPVHAIEGAAKSIHVIDQDKCTHCGTCFYSCPPRIGAIRKIAGEPVPPAVPAAERLIVRGSRQGA